jgi:hypothetical protein
MKKLKIILSPLIFLMTFACVNDEPDVVIQDENLNKFLNSSFYSSITEQGYQIDEDLIKYEETENGIGYVAPIKEFPSTMRVASAHAELVSVKRDFSNEDFKSFILAYENIPSAEENYSGDITVYDYSSSSDYVTFEFDDGKLISNFISSERALNNKMTCTGFRSVAACVGYRIEGMNFWDSVGFFSSFGISFGLEALSCYQDGCPYY